MSLCLSLLFVPSPSHSIHPLRSIFLFLSPFFSPSHPFLLTLPAHRALPGWPAPAAGEDGERIAPSDPRALLPRIPTQPISYADATPILAALTGARAPTAWQGGLPFTYHLGPGPVAVELSVESDNKVTMPVLSLSYLLSEPCICL